MNLRHIALGALLLSTACAASPSTPAPTAAFGPTAPFAAGILSGPTQFPTYAAPTVVPVCITPSPRAINYAIVTNSSLVKYGATGTFNMALKGQFNVTGQTLTFDQTPTGTCLYLTMTFDVRTATAPDSFMRGVMLNSMEADKYPTASFVLASNGAVSWPPSGGPIPPPMPIAIVTMQGTYQLHNQQHNVSNLSLEFFPMDARNGAWPLNIGMRFKLSDYGISIPAGLVQDDITLTAELTATPIEQF